MVKVSYASVQINLCYIANTLSVIVNHYNIYARVYNTHNSCKYMNIMNN